MTSILELGKPFKKTIGGRELIVVMLYENLIVLDKDYNEHKELISKHFINIDVSDKEKPEIWINEAVLKNEK